MQNRQRVYYFSNTKCDGNAKMADLLGGKGANLAGHRGGGFERDYLFAGFRRVHEGKWPCADHEAYPAAGNLACHNTRARTRSFHRSHTAFQTATAGKTQHPARRLLLGPYAGGYYH